VSGDDLDIMDLSYLDHEPSHLIAVPASLDDALEYLTKEVNKMLHKLGEFEYNRDDKTNYLNSFLGPYIFKENNSIYIG